MTTQEKQDDWAIHIFLEHSKEADAWSENETRGLVEEWEDKVDLDWCDGMWLTFYTHALGRHTVHKKHVNRCRVEILWTLESGLVH